MRLESWLTSDHDKTLRGLGEVFSEKSFAVTILFLMFVPALPLPTGGISHLFEAISVVVAAQMVAGRRTLWLPDRWQRRELGSLTTDKAVPFMIRRIRWFERFTRPRLRYLFTHRWSVQLLGLLLMGLSIILEDALVLAIGTAIGAVGTAIIFTIGAAVVNVVTGAI